AGCPGASRVSVAIAPTRRTHTTSCRARLRVTVSPSTARLARATTFHIGVRAVLGSLSEPVSGATVDFGQRRVRTDSRGRATLTLTLHRHIRRYGAVARAAGFVAGVGFVSVRSNASG